MTTSTGPGRDEVEKALADLTSGEADHGRDLWRRALAQAPQARVHAPGVRRPRRLAVRWAVAGVGVLAALVIAAGMLPTLGGPSLSGIAADRVRAGPAMSRVAANTTFPSSPAPDAGSARLVDAFSTKLMPDESAKADAPSRKVGPSGSESAIDSGAGDALMSIDRMVARKAWIRLRVPDVRAAFARIQALPSEPAAEYIESTSFSGGDDEKATGTVVLRVRAARLTPVLGQLRALGDTVEETASADDVTDQVVDVQARLSNERRVEGELLSLLERRSGAPLREVLELQQSIGQVRQTIERLTAQRDRVGRLVSLSTITVAIEHESAAGRSSPAALGVGERFGMTMSQAWAAALAMATDTLALLLKVAVGGLPLWLLLGVVGSFAWRRWGRGSAQADEPAPKF